MSQIQGFQILEYLNRLYWLSIPNLKIWNPKYSLEVIWKIFNIDMMLKVFWILEHFGLGMHNQYFNLLLFNGSKIQMCISSAWSYPVPIFSIHPFCTDL
jgi:hypothetical protein